MSCLHPCEVSVMRWQAPNYYPADGLKQHDHPELRRLWSKWKGHTSSGINFKVIKRSLLRLTFKQDRKGTWGEVKLKPVSVTLVHTDTKTESGPWFNIKMPSYQYRKSHCGDKTVVRSSYLHNGISYTGKMASFYWISPQGKCIYFKRTPWGITN